MELFSDITRVLFGVSIVCLFAYGFGERIMCAYQVRFKKQPKVLRSNLLLVAVCILSFANAVEAESVWWLVGSILLAIFFVLAAYASRNDLEFFGLNKDTITEQLIKALDELGLYYQKTKKGIEVPHENLLLEGPSYNNTYSFEILDEQKDYDLDETQLSKQLENTLNNNITTLTPDEQKIPIVVLFILVGLAGAVVTYLLV